MKWIKTSERQPATKGGYCVKLNDAEASKTDAYFDGDKWETYKNQFILEWLDESEEQSLSTPASLEDTLAKADQDLHQMIDDIGKYGKTGKSDLVIAHLSKAHEVIHNYEDVSTPIEVEGGRSAEEKIMEYADLLQPFIYLDTYDTPRIGGNGIALLLDKLASLSVGEGKEEQFKK